MTTDDQQPLILKAAGDVPGDLIVVAAVTAATLSCVYVPVLNESFLRILFGVAMVLFIPGYALIAALFPAKGDLDGIERVALSFGLSIAVVPLIGLALNYTPWGIRLDPILASLTVFTLAMTAIAWYRRLLLPAGDRFSVPARAMLGAARLELFDPEASRLDRALSVVLVVSIVAALATTAYVIAVPKEGEHFTEFYILGEKGKAADYPTNFPAGSTRSLIIGVGNHEYREIPYTVEALALNQTFDPATNTSTIHAAETLDRFVVTVPHNETRELPWNFSVSSPEYNRIEFLLFNETIPGEDVVGQDRINASYRDLHLWVRVR
jgi:Predicted membrane protein